MEERPILVNFQGSDNVAGVILARDYYNCHIAGFSIPAAEHSTICSWGKEHEVDAYRSMLKQFAKPGSLVAVVSDSYDLDNACENIWGGVLRDEVIKSGATVIIRPDSGDPAEIVLRTITNLSKTFGYTVNSKGFKVLNYVRVIQGDGINQYSIRKILRTLRTQEWSASNVAFGMGGQLLQAVNRDTQKFAYKCSSVTVNGIKRDVFKDPVTDPGKRSKAGRLDLIKDINGEFITIKLPDGAKHSENSQLETIFENGRILKEYTLQEIRTRANES